jgi:hypothetical protein
MDSMANQANQALEQSKKDEDLDKELNKMIDEDMDRFRKAAEDALVDR